MGFSESTAGSNKIQVIVKEFPDYEESYDNYNVDYTESIDNHVESETIARNEMEKKLTEDISQFDSQTSNSMIMVKVARKKQEDNLGDNIVKGCDSSAILDKVLNVLNSFSDITALIQEVRKLEQKVLKMGKVLRKHGLVEDAKEVNVPRSFALILA